MKFLGNNSILKFLIILILFIPFILITSCTSSSNPRVTDKLNLEPVDSCKLKFIGSNTDLFLGFPRDSKYPKSTGNRKAVVLFVYFQDLPADERAITEWQKVQIPFAEKAYLSMSSGKYQIKYEIVDKFYKLNGSYKQYYLDRNFVGFRNALQLNHQKILKETLFRADKDVDFSNFDYINIVTPIFSPKAEPGASGGGGFFVDGKNFFLSNIGPFDEYIGDANKANFLLHESGHILGLIHIYSDAGIFGAWDVMGNSFGVNELLGWNKLFLGWIDDQEVRCMNLNSSRDSIHLISPFGEDIEKPKLLILKLSETKALVVEVRISTALDSLETKYEGVIAYTVDTSKSSAVGAVSIISNPSNLGIDKLGRAVTYGAMKVGEFAITQGIKVEVLKKVKESYLIKISQD